MRVAAATAQQYALITSLLRSDRPAAANECVATLTTFVDLQHRSLDRLSRATTGGDGGGWEKEEDNEAGASVGGALSRDHTSALEFCASLASELADARREKQEALVSLEALQTAWSAREIDHERTTCALRSDVQRVSLHRHRHHQRYRHRLFGP